jgi:hypothetical protein
MSDETRLMDLAQRAREAIPVVHGIAAARLNGNEVDAALLIQRYHEEAAADGVHPIQAWTSLFSAAMLTLGDTVELVAEATGQPDHRVLAGMAMQFQLEQG